MTRSTLAPTQILQEAYDEANQALRVTGDFAATDHTHTGTYVPVLATPPVALLGVLRDGNTNFSTNAADSGRLYSVCLQSSGAQNAEVYWDEYLAAGTYSFTLVHHPDTNRGVYSVQVDGVEVGTIEGYAGSASNNAVGAVTGVVIATTGTKRIKLKMATKHASSAGYYGLFSLLRVRRTA